MIIRKIWPLILVLGTAAQSATLPIKPGTYVLAGVPCSDPPFAATFDFDGKRFSYPHASDCRSVVHAQGGHTYRVRETCSALGDGSPTKADTTEATYKILSADMVRIVRGAKGASNYRRCPSSQPKKKS